MVLGLILIGSGLVISGILATGFLADEIGQALHQVGRLTNFRNQTEVITALIESNRADLAQKLLIAQTQVDLSAFNVQEGQNILSGLGQTSNLALLAIAGFVAFKVLK